MLRILGSSIGLLVLLAAFPGRVPGQEIKAGIATIIEGDVTTRRVSLPRPIPLKFRDDVLRHDTITTAERSLARLLLGGKAIVTVRERSRLTVTETPGISLVELGEGKVGLAVLRQRMRPGDVVEIRTHNALIAVRGTVVIAEIAPASGASSSAPALLSNVYVLTGKVEVQELRGGVPVGPVYPVNRRQMITISPLGPPQVTSIPESRVAGITADLQPSSVGAGGSAAQAAAKEAAMRAAVDDLSEASLGDEERRREDWYVRAPIVPTLPGVPDAPVASTASSDLSSGLPGPVAPLPGPPALVRTPAQPPVQGTSPVRPPIRANPPAVVAPSPGAANLALPSNRGSSTLPPPGTTTIAPPAAQLGVFTGATPNARAPR